MLEKIESKIFRFKNNILGIKKITIKVNNISFLVTTKYAPNHWYNIRKNKSWNDGTGYAIQAILNKSDSFIDIGCWFGKMSLIGAKSVGRNGKVFSFDPDPICNKGINENIRLNNLENVFVFQMAIGSSNGEISLNINDGLGSSKNSIISNNDKNNSKESLIVKQYTLVHFINKYDISPKLIKIDAEGAEHAIYLGSKNYFLNKKPNLIIELHRKILSDNKLKDLYSWFSRYNHIILLDDLLDDRHYCGDEIDLETLKFSKRSGFNFFLTNDSQLSNEVQMEISKNKNVT